MKDSKWGVYCTSLCLHIDCQTRMMKIALGDNHSFCIIYENHWIWNKKQKQKTEHVPYIQNTYVTTDNKRKREPEIEKIFWQETKGIVIWQREKKYIWNSIRFNISQSINLLAGNRTYTHTVIYQFQCPWIVIQVSKQKNCLYSNEMQLNWFSKQWKKEEFKCSRNEMQNRKKKHLVYWIIIGHIPKKQKKNENQKKLDNGWNKKKNENFQTFLPKLSQKNKK